MKHLPLMLEGSARAWLTQLPPSSIYTWEDLSRVFVRTFEGTCKRPAGLTELQVCVQKTNETLREYIQRWITLHHTVENVSDHQAVCAFKDGVKNRELSLKFGRTGDMTLSRMMEIATKYANGEDEDRLRSGKRRQPMRHGCRRRAASSIYTWEDLSRVFVRTFEGTCKRPAGLTELQVCVQKTNETLREYIQRWITLHHTVENVSDHQAVCAFKDGVKNRELSLKFGRTGDMTLSRMMEIATKYANGEEEDRLRSGKHKPSQSEKGNTSRKQKRKAEPAAPGEALAVTQGKFKGKPKGSWNPKKVKDKEGNDVMDMPCHIHTKKDEEGNIIYPKHTTRQCRLLIQQFQGKQSKDKEKESDKAEDKEDSEEGYPHVNSTLMIFADVESKSRLKGNIIYPKHTTRQCRLLIQQFQGKQSKDKEKESDKAEDKEDSEEGYPHVNSTLMIFADVESKSRLKVINREVNMVTPAKANYLKWSQTAITFDQSDHPTHIATPGRQALVVDPVVEGTRLTKVLMDGGSGLNLLYADTLKGMGIPMSRLSTSNMSFHGVIPGKKAESLGQIALDVVFGDSKHFRKEKLTFEVVDFQSAYHAILGRPAYARFMARYHAILGRPAYARFMARPCYVYLKLKMPGPKGVITVTGDRKKAEECFQKGSKIADSQVTAVEFEEYKQNADPSDLLRSKKPATESAFQSSGETKPVHIHPTDPDSKIADSQVTAVEFEEYKQNADPSDLLRSKKPATESAFQSSGETKPVHIHPTDPEAAPTRISTTLDPK